MTYNTAELRLLTDRLVADGMNHWTYDTADALATVIAAGYISDAHKTDNGRGVALGDRVTIRRWADVSTKASLLSITDHDVIAVTAGTGATLSSDSSIRAIIDDGASVALLAGQSGALCVFNKTDGALFTLPSAEPGLEFDFIIAADAASVGYKVICTSGDFIVGTILMDDGDTGLTTSAAAFNGTTHLAIDINGATDGWLAGGFFSLVAISTTQWAIKGHLLHTGNVASPAATS